MNLQVEGSWKREINGTSGQNLFACLETIIILRCYPLSAAYRTIKQLRDTEGLESGDLQGRVLSSLVFHWRHAMTFFCSFASKCPHGKRHLNQV